jgi:hypothetical protein
MIVPAAYKFISIILMLWEINYCSERLRLPTDLPVKEQDLRAESVFPPSVIGFAGRLDTSKFSFSFAKSGRLRFITKLDDGRGNQTLHEYLEHLSQVKSTINTNNAYRIATNWLAAMEIDLPRLEKEHPPAVRQQTFVPWAGFATNNAETPLPIFDVKWGDWARPVIDIQISGATGELLKLRQEDDSYSKRPASLIKDMDKLLAISDEEFQKYSPSERSNLVVRFAAVQYPALTKPSFPETNSVSPVPQNGNSTAKQN